ncbi:MAG: hypothetical protein PVH07_10765 [Chloroflexota bacterium]|jgi:2-polyprenyl-6-methoxyphenol hydroxylase-like FAD-dependent oxidoreductase
MSKQKFVAVLAAGALALTVAVPALAKGGPPAGVGEGAPPAGIQCQQAGIGTLQTLGLLPAVAKDGIEVVGVGTLDFPTVLFLHRTQPELFQTGGVSVVVPGVGPVAATWCD